MTTLYSLRSPSSITKWDAEGNPIATYDVSRDVCTCPAGQRPTCRHRQMLPSLEPYRDTHWFIIWEPQGEIRHGQIVDINGTPKTMIDRLTMNETVRNSECESRPAQAVSLDAVTPQPILEVPAVSALPEGPECRTEPTFIDEASPVKEEIWLTFNEPATAKPWRRM